MKRHSILHASLTLFIALTLTLPLGCKERIEEYDYDKAVILTDATNGAILPQLGLFRYEAASLQASVAQFVQQPDSITLAAARAQFIQADLRWKACEIYDIGLVMERHIHSRISKWPTDPGLIEGGISSANTMDAAYFEALGSTSRGLPAVEYLLFDHDMGATLAAYTTDSLAARRRGYLEGVANNLLTKATELQNIWLATGENYAQTFANSAASGLQDPMGLLVNGMISTLEEVTKTKIGKPFGKFDLGILQPDLVESTRANISKELLRANVVALQALYLGSAHTGLDQALDDLHAKYEEADLSLKIAQQFDVVVLAIDQITLPLQDALLNQHDQVDAAYQALKALIVLFKADLCSAMSITVTVTDADGD
jgi:uncharacterized protein